MKGKMTEHHLGSISIAFGLAIKRKVYSLPTTQPFCDSDICFQEGSLFLFLPKLVLTSILPCMSPQNKRLGVKRANQCFSESQTRLLARFLKGTRQLPRVWGSRPPFLEGFQKTANFCGAPFSETLKRPVFEPIPGPPPETARGAKPSSAQFAHNAALGFRAGRFGFLKPK